MRRLGAEETAQIEHDALRAIIEHACEVAAAVLGITIAEATLVHETPCMGELLARDVDRLRFIDLWEDCVLEACERADLLRDDEFMIRAQGGFPGGRLTTHIYIYSEQDFSDE